MKLTWQLTVLPKNVHSWTGIVGVSSAVAHTNWSLGKVPGGQRQESQKGEKESGEVMAQG